MKKHIKMATLLFLIGLFILPVTAFGHIGITGNYPDKITAVMAVQTQVQLHTLATEKICRIEALQEKLLEDNADILKQLITNAQNEIMANIQEEIKNLSAKLTQKRINL